MHSGMVAARQIWAALVASSLHAVMAMLKPVPSAPTRFSAGTWTSSKLTEVVGCAFQPSLRSGLPKLKPGVSCNHGQPDHLDMEADQDASSMGWSHHA